MIDQYKNTKEHLKNWSCSWFLPLHASYYASISYWDHLSWVWRLLLHSSTLIFIQVFIQDKHMVSGIHSSLEAKFRACFAWSRSCNLQEWLPILSHSLQYILDNAHLEQNHEQSDWCSNFLVQETTRSRQIHQTPFLNRGMARARLLICKQKQLNDKCTCT